MQRSAAFIPGEIPRYSIYRRFNRPQGQYRDEGVKKISTTPTPGIEPGRPARSQEPCRLRIPMGHFEICIFKLILKNNVTETNGLIKLEISMLSTVSLLYDLAGGSTCR